MGQSNDELDGGALVIERARRSTQWMPEHHRIMIESVCRMAEQAEPTGLRAQLAELVDPIIERFGDRIGTHMVDEGCVGHHIECLAAAVKRRIEVGDE